MIAQGTNEGKKRRSELVLNDTFEKTQQKALHILRPTSKVRLTIEDAMNCTNDHLGIPWEDMIKSIEQTVMIVSQTVNCLTYNRQVSALTAVMGDKHIAKTTIREQIQLLKRAGANLFGTGFRKYIFDASKAMKESKDVYRNSRNNNKRPFGAAAHF